MVTGFSGTTLAANRSPQAARNANGLPSLIPLIDFDGYAMRILRPTPNEPAQGQLIDAPPVFGVKAGQVGQVFGIALDDAAVPNIYLAATSAFGVHIVVSDPVDATQLDRAKNGAPNADWMIGQFGSGGPGGIYKVDGQTGAVSLFATIPGNSGPGLGGIVFDSATRQFFVADLDTGLIHRLDATGKPLDTFDHGVVDDARPACARCPMTASK